MDSMTNLNDFKNLKKLKIMANDLKEIQIRLTSCLESLKEYKKYIPVMESMSILHNSRTIVEININKYNQLVRNYNKEVGK